MLGINPERFKDESYEDYKARRKETNKQIKNYLKGRVVYNSRKPYVKKDTAVSGVSGVDDS